MTACGSGLTEPRNVEVRLGTPVADLVAARGGYRGTPERLIMGGLGIAAHPELYEKYFRGWLKAHKLLQEDTEEYAGVYTKALQEVGDKAEYDVILPVVKRLRSEVFISKEVKTYLNDMGDKQIKLGWIQRHPDFTKSKMLDDSILRKVAREMGWDTPTN